MNKSWFYLGLIGSLAVFTTSCGGDSGKPATPTASPSAVASPAAAVPPTVPATPAATTAPKPTLAAAPTVPGTSPATKPVSVDVAAGLIPPTDGDNWAKTVSKGRSDPFAMLTLQPVEVAAPAPIKGTGKPQKTGSSIASSSGNVSNNSKKITTIASNSSGIKSGVNKALPTIKISTSALPKGTSFAKQSPPTVKTDKIAAPPTPPAKVSAKGKIASNGVIPTGFAPGTPEQGYTRPGTGYLNDHNLPISAIPRSGINKVLPKIINELPAAKPEQAPALEISGVIEVAGKTQVIVKLPSESFSRYVEVGDRIADGKVLVKRVEDRQSLSPTIVLEEVGIEVPRKIGVK